MKATLTKMQMAQTITQALYNMTSTPLQSHFYVQRLIKHTKDDLSGQLPLAQRVIAARSTI